MERSIGWFKKETLNDDEQRHALAHELGIPFVELGRDTISPDALILIPEPLAREHNLLGYKLSEHSLEVALLDMDDLAHLEFLRSQYRVLPRLTSRESLNRGLVRYQQHLKETYGKKLEDPSSPNLLDTLLRHALHSRATDLHLQSDEGGLLVRYRINGTLRSAMTLPHAAAATVFSKLRSLTGLPTGVAREGRLRVDLGSGEDLSVRVSSVPIVAGEKMVLHLSREKARRGHTLESLGLHGEALEAVHHMLLKRRGLVVVTGAPQGGKSTLLYTLLDLLNVPEHSLATVEEEVEYALPRVAQSDLTVLKVSAAAALRAALKADSDVVMIGRVESAEVARIAEKAAERGVLVIAGTENPDLFDAADLLIRTATLRRLGDKQIADTHKLTRVQADGLEAGANFAHVLAALKEEGKVEKDVAWKDVQFSRPVPSTEHPQGYLGLIGVQEVIRGGKPVGLSLVEDALFKAATGLTSVEEVRTLL
jgi:type IV pilus assembly protein PilB